MQIEEEGADVHEQQDDRDHQNPFVARPGATSRPFQTFVHPAISHQGEEVGPQVLSRGPGNGDRRREHNGAELQHPRRHPAVEHGLQVTPEPPVQAPESVVVAPARKTSRPKGSPACESRNPSSSTWAQTG